MSNDQMHYNKSNMPAKSGEPSPDRGPRQDQGEIALRSTDPVRGDVVGYPSLESQGLVEIELPSRNPTHVGMVEKMRLCDFGKHVEKQVERDLASSPAEASITLSWYGGVARGAKLFDDATLAEFGKLTHAFSGASDPEQFFADEVQPFLSGLVPRKR